MYLVTLLLDKIVLCIYFYNNACSSDKPEGCACMQYAWAFSCMLRTTTVYYIAPGLYFNVSLAVCADIYVLHRIIAVDILTVFLDLHLYTINSLYILYLIVWKVHAVYAYMGEQMTSKHKSVQLCTAWDGDNVHTSLLGVGLDSV